uniref:Uncharacterized protein n=1 Tax=Megaselia scalaris TaxID=36166 RepID=T1GDM9_MEGSC
MSLKNPNKRSPLPPRSHSIHNFQYGGYKDLIRNIKQADCSVVLELTSIPFFENWTDYAQVPFLWHLFATPDFC